ncbi:MAG: hypothetical protein KDE19_21850, partial [Caldilineaceae bacterium]|nr:hypothetical protein [Caldilineaceae bacterium]
MLKRQRLFDLFTVGLCLLMVLTPINRPSAHAQSAPPAALAPLSVGILDEFTQSALSEVITVYTEAQGYQVEQVPIDSPTALLEALATGTVDLALALPVDALVTHHHLPLNALPTDQTRLLQLIQSLGAKEGVVWATPTAIQYNHTFWVHAAMAEEIADLPTLLARFSDGTIPTVAPEAADAPPTICAPADQAEALAETVEALQAEVGRELDVTQVLIDDAPQPATPHSTPIITTAASFSGTLAVSAVPISATTGTFTATLPISATRASTSFFAPCTLAFDLSTSQTMRAAGLVPLADPASFFPANPLTLVYRTAAFPAGSPLPPELDQVVATMDAA